VLIQRNVETVAVLTSPQQYETTREAKAERVIKSMREFGEHMQRVATAEEHDALEKELHQLAR
jgi:cell division GTPase FtsZ